MTEPSSQFRVVLRGYEPAEVDRRIQELMVAVQEAARQRDDLDARLAAIESARRRQGQPAEPETPTFEHFGERIGQILALAEQEAAELRRAGAQELARQHSELAQQVGQIRGEADRYATDVRSDAEAEAARILEDARRAADERIDTADRDAAARIQEAEAIYEEQRARSAKAAADFETTLASRRKAAEAELTKALGEANARLEEAAGIVEQARSEAEQMTNQATLEARRLLDDAELQATTIVNDAKALAVRVRADSERELIAATQRRDSINAQLANVRQMLATLTGTAPLTLDDNLPELPGQPIPERGSLAAAAD